MKKETLQLTYDVYASAEALAVDDAALLQQAREVAGHAYAPYSHFNVGAAAQLTNGKTVTGTNQENAAYPAGICAERALLANAATLFPGMPIVTMAISYQNENGASDHPISPCGICRQTLVEYEERVQQSMRLILGGQSGEVFIIHNAGQLLPLSFGKDDLTR